MENKIIIDNYTMLDRMLKQERKYTLDLVKKIKKVETISDIHLGTLIS